MQLQRSARDPEVLLAVHAERQVMMTRTKWRTSLSMPSYLVDSGRVCRSAKSPPRDGDEDSREDDENDDINLLFFSFLLRAFFFFCQRFFFVEKTPIKFFSAGKKTNKQTNKQTSLSDRLDGVDRESIAGQYLEHQEGMDICLKGRQETSR